MPVYYYLIAVAIGVGVGVWKRRWDVSLLVVYVFMIFVLAILRRTPGDTRRYELDLFWSWGKPSLRTEIIANVIAFIPIGILGYRKLGWKAILLGLGVSAFIETTQLFAHRGLFEFDDMIHNTLGTAVGYGIMAGVRRLKKDV